MALNNDDWRRRRAIATSAAVLRPMTSGLWSNNTNTIHRARSCALSLAVVHAGVATFCGDGK